MTRPQAHFFAPGAIERAEAARRKELRRWLRNAARLMLAATVVGLLAGLATGARASEPATTQAADAAPSRPALLPTTLGLHLHSLAARLSWVHKSAADADHAVHLSVEWSL